VPRYRTPRRVLAGACALAAGIALLLLSPSPAHADPRPLGLRFAGTGWLGVEQAGNALLSCPANSSASGEPCAAAQAGGVVGNDDYRMSYVDSDADPTTFDSSSAQLIAPPGAGIAFAGLYWGGDSGSANAAGTTGCQSSSSAGQVAAPPAPGHAGQVLVKVGSDGYVGVVASTLDRLDNPLGGGTYQGFADITALLSGFAGAPVAKPIPLTVANAQLAQGRNCAGGWSVVLVYRYPATDPNYAPAWRSVQIFDGLAVAGPGVPVSATADGFRVATDGAPVASQVGVVLYGADRSGSGGQLSVNGTAADDTIGDATVAGSGYGAPLSPLGATAPVYQNNLGYESRALDVALTPGVTSASASVTVPTGSVTVGALLLVTRVDPLLAANLSVSREDGSPLDHKDVVAGQRLRFTLQLASLAPATRLAITAPPPSGLAPVSGSLTLNGAPIDPAALTGEGVNLQLGALDPGATTLLTWDATVARDAPAGVPLVSRATVIYDVAGVSLRGYSDQATVLANRVDLALRQVPSGTTVGPDQPTKLTLTITNQGKVPATGVTATTGIPMGLTDVTADTAQGSYDATTGIWTVGGLAPGAAATLSLSVIPGSPPATAPPGAAASASPTPSAGTPAPASSQPSTWTAQVTSEITAVDQPDVDSVPGDGLAGEDDFASQTFTVTAPTASPTAAPSPTGVLAGTAKRPRWSTDSLVTLLAAALGAVMIALGALVYGTARRAGRPPARLPAPRPVQRPRTRTGGRTR
jgi:large repetitive protein